MNFIDEYLTDDDGNNHIFDRFFNNIPKNDIEQEIKNLRHEWPIGELLSLMKYIHSNQQWFSD